MNAFAASDGSLFKTRDEALKHDAVAFVEDLYEAAKSGGSEREICQRLFDKLCDMGYERTPAQARSDS